MANITQRSGFRVWGYHKGTRKPGPTPKTLNLKPETPKRSDSFFSGTKPLSHRTLIEALNSRDD